MSHLSLSLFLSLSPDPVLSDCPDFHSLAPPSRLRMLPFKLGRGRGRREGGGRGGGGGGERDSLDGYSVESGSGEGWEGGEGSEEMRMCGKCHKLMKRYVHNITVQIRCKV